ncbi:MAG: sulfatase [Candidatus Hydrogenedentes bacterium]|nr:sulfatase [Candidatus Hydrogenedentota bacterium]
MAKLEAAGTRAFYRFDDNLSKASTLKVRRIVRERGEPLSMKVTDFVGWTTGAASSRTAVESGRLVFETRDADTLTSPSTLSIPVRQTESLVIRMGGAGTDKISVAWRGDSSEEFQADAAIDIALTSGEATQAYEIRVGALRGWSAPNTAIRQLRFSVPSKAKIAIESIRAVSRYERFMAHDAGIVHFALNHDSRTCLFLHAPGEVHYPMRVFDGAHFAAGLATLDAEPPVTFSLSVRTGATESSLVQDEAQATMWRNVSSDLSAYSGQDVEVTIKAECAEPGNVLLISSPLLYQASAGRHEKPINVIWYIIDALRPDHLDAYGYSRETAPVIAQIAEEGVRFERCFSSATWTKPSVTSMMTGVSPLVHHAGMGQELPHDGLALLPQELRGIGYTTISVTQSPFGPRNGYLDKGFDVVAGTGIGPMSSGAQSLLSVPRDRPFFLLMHVLDTHPLYWPPLSFMQFRAEGGRLGPMDLYDARIGWADSNMNVFIKVLRDIGLYDHTLLIITADHGEGLEGDVGGLGHGGKPYLSRARVPLIMRLPGALPAGIVVKDNVQLLDIGPTLLDIIGAPPNMQFQGASLVGLMRGGTAAAFQARSLYCIGQQPEWKGMAKRDWYLFDDDGKVGLFHFPSDPGQNHDVAAQQEAVAKAMADELTRYAAEQEAVRNALGTEPGSAALPVDPQTAQQLKALGYL